MMRLARDIWCESVLALAQLVRLSLGFLEIERPLVDRAARYHRVDAFGLDLAEGLDVLDAGQAAARDHGNAQAAGELQGGVDVDAGEHAVAADVGVDDRFDAVVLELLGK